MLAVLLVELCKKKKKKEKIISIQFSERVYDVFERLACLKN